MRTIITGILLGSAFLMSSVAFAQYDSCGECVPQSRSDNIDPAHLACVSDEYLTGYIQSLIDMHYYEFQVRVMVRNRVVYVFNLPCNELIAGSIMWFIYDVPCIDGIERVECSPEEYFCTTCPNEAAAICESSCYESMCTMPEPCSHIRGIWLPQQTVLFAPLIADPRQVTNSIAMRFNDNSIGQHTGAVSFGDDFGIFRWFDVWPMHGDLQFDIEAGIFAVFDMDHPEACMVNTDFFVALMPTYAFDRWSFRLRLWHLSSHLGDEFLLANPGFPRANLSDEGIDFFASYQLNPAIRLYGGVGDIFRRDESFPEKPFYFEFGTEIRAFGWKSRYDRLYIQPFLAMNFGSWNEHDYCIDQTYCLGLEWSKIQGVGRKVRFFAEYHEGFSQEGQFVRQRVDYVAIRFTYGY